MEKEIESHLVFLHGEFRGQRSLVGYSQWGRQESDMTEWLTQQRELRHLSFLSLDPSRIWKVLGSQQEPFRKEERKVTIWQLQEPQDILDFKMRGVAN